MKPNPLVISEILISNSKFSGYNKGKTPKYGV